MRFFAVLALLVCGAIARVHPDGWRLVRVHPKIEFWASPEQIDSMAMDKTGFVDVTDTPDLEKWAQSRSVVEQSYPTSPRQATTVRSIMPQVNMQLYNSTLTTFSNFHTRHRSSPVGVEAAEWLREQAANALGNIGVVTTFRNSQFNQFNVIARIEGDGTDNNLVILGAHLDSVAGGVNARAPGADDDGSGSMMILEVLRVIASNIRSGQFRLKRPVEFHWYAGEEGGLVGSRNQAQDYARRNVPVYSMFQFDMIGFPSTFNTPIGVVTDYTSQPLTNFMRILIDTYLTLGRADRPCGYGCSDHASWTSAGYPAVFPFEAPFGQHSNFIHSARDTIANNVDMARSEQFAHLAVAYVVEASLA